MTAPEIEDQVKKLILQQVGLFTRRSDLSTLAAKERLDGPALGYDSFDRIELVMALEEELALDPDIPEEASQKWTTVGDVVRYCVDAARAKEQKEAE